MKLVVSRSARNDIREIVTFISQDRPHAAMRWRAEMMSRLDAVRRWPLAGRIVPELEDPAIREIIVGNYRVLYRATSHRVEVFLVLDGRREFPSTTREPGVEYELRATR